SSIIDGASARRKSCLLDASNSASRRFAGLTSFTARNIGCTSPARRIRLVRGMVAALFVLATSARAGAALTPVSNFGSIPGALSMFTYVPQALPAGRPVVVVMHGCSQSAASMEATGWNKLADQ